MSRYCLLALALLLTLPAAAQQPSQPAKTARPQAAPATPSRDLLKGTWQATDDKNSLVIITDNQYTERYAGQPDESYRLRILDRACDAPATTKTDGRLYLQATAADPGNSMCFYVVGVSAKTLELSLVGGRGSTLRFRRLAQSLSKRQGMP